MLTKIFDLAQEYDKQLCYRKVLFCSSNYCINAVFHPRNFLHLTGIETQLDCHDFFRKALHQKLHIKDIAPRDDQTTKLKLSVLSSLIACPKTAQMIGPFNGVGRLIQTDILAGTVIACMGFKRNKDIYFPNTALKLDIRRKTKFTEQILFVAVTPRKQLAYEIVRNKVKDLSQVPLGKYQGLLMDCAQLAKQRQTYDGRILGVTENLIFQETSTGLIKHIRSHLTGNFQVSHDPVRIGYCHDRGFLLRAPQDRGLELER